MYPEDQMRHDVARLRRSQEALLDDHPDIETIADYLDNVLDQEAIPTLQEHLAICSACSGKLLLLKEAEENTPSLLDEGAEPFEDGNQLGGERSGLPAWFPAAAAAVLLFAVTVAVLWIASDDGRETVISVDASLYPYERIVTKSDAGAIDAAAFKEIPSPDDEQTLYLLLQQPASWDYGGTPEYTIEVWEEAGSESLWRTQGSLSGASGQLLVKLPSRIVSGPRKRLRLKVFAGGESFSADYLFRGKNP